MGPTLIFDKSFLESLNVSESVWLDAFFLTNITPLFFIESLADLEKQVKDGRTPAQVVGNLALKTPDNYAFPNAHHTTLIMGELTGMDTIDMDFGRPIVGGGRETELDGKRGVVYQQSPEAEALNRWQAREFLELERQQAKAWRRDLSSFSPEKHREYFLGWYGLEKPTTLGEVKKRADRIIDEADRRKSLGYGMDLLGISPNAQTSVFQRWEELGSLPLVDFAPYFRYVYGIELFFYYALAADLISTRQSNKADIAYLYYLPFCTIFTSNDNLHAKTVPLFLRSDQAFIPGQVLKNDLRAIDRYYDALPDEVKEKGVYHFAPCPPIDQSFLVTELWDRYMRSDWRKLSLSVTKIKDEKHDAETVAEIRRNAEAPSSSDSSHNGKNPDYIITTHYVHAKKGKWRIVSREVEESGRK